MKRVVYRRRNGSNGHVRCSVSLVRKCKFNNSDICIYQIGNILKIRIVQNCTLRNVGTTINR